MTLTAISACSSALSGLGGSKGRGIGDFGGGGLEEWWGARWPSSPEPPGARRGGAAHGAAAAPGRFERAERPAEHALLLRDGVGDELVHAERLRGDGRPGRQKLGLGLGMGLGLGLELGLGLGLGLSGGRASDCAAVVGGCCGRQRLQVQRDTAGEQRGVPQSRLWLAGQAGSPHSPQRDTVVALRGQLVPPTPPLGDHWRLRCSLGCHGLAHARTGERIRVAAAADKVVDRLLGRLAGDLADRLDLADAP